VLWVMKDVVGYHHHERGSKTLEEGAPGTDFPPISAQSEMEALAVFDAAFRLKDADWVGFDLGTFAAFACAGAKRDENIGLSPLSLQTTLSPATTSSA
jgi:hypothetical protein